MESLHEFFRLNRPLLLFVYGQTFFIMGLAIFLQSRRHSRLRLARDLRWLAAFGILHGLHEWGDIFIPIQTNYLPLVYTQLLSVLQIVLLALSFTCLLIFGSVALDRKWSRARQIVVAVVVVWVVLFWTSLYAAPNLEQGQHLASTWARYLLGLPGSLLAAYALRYQAEVDVKPLGVGNIYRTLRVAGFALVAYAFVGGLIVSGDGFFPANTLNRQAVEALIGVPIEVFRSLAGLILAVSMIRTLEIFDIEVDRLIEGMEVERIQATERDRIGQEIHDGAIQAVYSASLILDSMQPFVAENAEANTRLDRAKRVLSTANSDLRRYMISLRADTPSKPLSVELRHLAADPRFSSLLQIDLKLEVEPDLNPTQVGYVIAIVQESLSNAVRHANARRMAIHLWQNEAGLTLQLNDDGQGFDERTMTHGFGLRAMRDRARLLGGSLTLETHAGKGTTVTLWLPEEITADDSAARAAGR